MISHIVIIWLAPSQRDRATALREAAARLLPAIPGVRNFVAGPPIEMDRAVVDGSYQLALSMNFDTREDAEAYQTHPLHTEFVAGHLRPLGPRIFVYDFEQK